MNITSKHPYLLSFIIGGLMAFLFFIISEKAFAAGENLISNSDFSNSSVSNVPDFFTTGGYGVSSSTFVYPVAGPSGADDKAAQITITNYADGDAKWVPKTVPVIPGRQYAFSDSYTSTANTQVFASYCADADCLIPATPTNANGWVNLSPTAPLSWVTANAVFTVPEGAAYMRVMHILFSNGTLAVDNYNLTELPDSRFSKGFVSLAFDDGWQSQFDNAFPILRNAGFHASYFLISRPFLDAGISDDPNILCNDTANPRCDGVQISTTPTAWIAASQYPDRNQPTYFFSGMYTSNAPSTTTISYFNNGVAISDKQNIVLNVSPAGTNASNSFQFTIPGEVFSLISSSTAISFTIEQRVSDEPSSNSLVVNSARITPPQSFTDTYFNRVDAQALLDAGEEIGAHTKDHCSLVALLADPNSATTGACASILSAATTAREQVFGSRDEINSVISSPVDTFVYPYGDYNSGVKALLEEAGFIGARSVLTGTNTKNTDRFALQTRIVNKALTDQGQVGIDLVKSWIDEAVANKTWLILTFHGVFSQAQMDNLSVTTPGATTDATTISFFQSIVNYLKSGKSEEVCVETMRNGLNVMRDLREPCASVSVPADTTGPSISNVPTNITQYTNTNSPVAVTFTNPGATDASLPVTVACLPVSGSSFAVGTTTVTCTATDSAPALNSTTATFQVGVVYVAPVVATSTDISITPVSLPAGVVGTAYSQVLTASSSSLGTLDWSIASGTLPAGLTFATTSATILGTPTTNGIFDFVISLINGNISSTTQGYTLTVTNPVTPTPTPAPTPSPAVSSGGGGGGGGIISSSKKGDINRDGKIDILDLVLMMSFWAKLPVDGGSDLNSDGNVGILDYVLLMANWNK